MTIIEDERGMARAIATVHNPWLRRLLAVRRDQLAGADPYGPLIVVDGGDSLDAIEAAAGLPIATNLVDGEAWPSPDFTPCWEWCLSANGWHEIAYVLGDESGGAVLFVPDRDGVDPTLRAIIHAFAG